MKWLLLLLFFVNIDSYLTPQIIKPFIKHKFKYLQGLYFSDNKLVYGTNNGYLSCLFKNDDGILSEKWSVQHNKRNIKKISCQDDKLIIQCDAENYDTTGMTNILDIKNGQLLYQFEWTDTSIFEYITEDNQFIRCNPKGYIYIYCLDTLKNRNILFSLPKNDFIISATYHKKYIYMTSFNGIFYIVDVKESKMISKINLNNILITTMNIHIYQNNENSLFLYTGDMNGVLSFYHIVDQKKILSSHNQKKILSHSQTKYNDCPMTSIQMSVKGPIMSFTDSRIIGVQYLTFAPFLNISMNTNFYINIHSIYVSSLLLFTLTHDNNICIFSFK
jgi:hypothetical protein